MIEALDLIFSFIILLTAMTYLIMSYYRINKMVIQNTENVSVNYLGKYEVEHILYTGIPSKVSKYSSFRFSIISNNTTYVNLNYLGYTSCQYIYYVTSSGMGTLIVCT